MNESIALQPLARLHEGASVSTAQTTPGGLQGYETVDRIFSKTLVA